MLPAKFDRTFPWRMDRRCQDARELAAELAELWHDMGGVENLSKRQQILCQRIAQLQIKILRYDDDRAAGRETQITEGEYGNACNLLKGYINDLSKENSGLGRKARGIGTLQDRLRQKRQPVTLDGTSADSGGASAP